GTMKIGVASLWRNDLEAFRSELRLAERHGFDLVTVGDTQSLFREVYVSLAVAAMATEHCLIGPMVTNPVTRHPAVSASAVAALDELSNGRAIFGIGTGASALWALGEKPAGVSELRTYLETFRALQSIGTSRWRGREVWVDVID